MLLAFDAFLMLVCALFICSTLKLNTTLSFLLGWFLIFYANLVLTAEIAGTFFLLNDRRFFILVHLFLVAAASMIWWYAGRPAVLPQFFRSDYCLLRQNAGIYVKSNPALLLLGISLAVAYGVGAVLILIVPPNNYDSMTYHLSRVGYWLQHGSLYHWATANPRQVSFSFNAELGTLWTVLFWRSDQLVGFVQWITVPVCMTAIWGLARLCHFNKSGSLFAALVWATFPQIVLQSTTTQNDLVVSAFFISMIYLLFLGIKTQHSATLLLSSIAFGLGVGTKVTMLLALPGVGIVLITWLIVGKRQHVRLLLQWATASLVAFLCLGMYSYFLNLVAYRNPLGPKEFVEDSHQSELGQVEEIEVNYFRYLYYSVDESGLPDRMAGRLHYLKVNIADKLFNILSVPVESSSDEATFVSSFNMSLRYGIHEDFSWFGPLGTICFVSCLIIQTIVSFSRRDAYRLSLAIIAWCFIFTTIVIIPWSPFRGRYFVLIVTASAPLFASWGFLESRSRITYWGVIGLALLILGWTVTHNPHKPLVESPTIWDRDEVGRRAFSFPVMEPMLRATEALPSRMTLGVLIGPDDWDYPLFGESFNRRIIQVGPDALNAQWFREQGVDLLYARYDLLPRTTPACFETVAQISTFYLIRCNSDG